ncbi:MAG: hypothetical protein AAEF72_01920, partial [Gammaproteobacteria bacterium]
GGWYWRLICWRRLHFDIHPHWRFNRDEPEYQYLPIGNWYGTVFFVVYINDALGTFRILFVKSERRV